MSAARTLSKAKDVIKREGWQNNPTRSALDHGGSVTIMDALAKAEGVRGWGRVSSAVLGPVCIAAGVRGWGELCKWEDRRGRTVSDVLKVLDKAIEAVR